ncbi:MAG: hypothetical protein LBF68_03400 [Christensenellaceae bacterium]|nr:hypothetical protein [Christensenellaceae bacterium]
MNNVEDKKSQDLNVENPSAMKEEMSEEEKKERLNEDHTRAVIKTLEKDILSAFPGLGAHLIIASSTPFKYSDKHHTKK